MIKKLMLGLCCFLAIPNTLLSQAKLTIENDSKRQMNVKVMKADGWNGELYTTVYIEPGGFETIYFNETGNYFTKTKAILDGKKPVFRKGERFKVYNGADGYSVLTLTFTITESNVVQASGGKEITKSEFEQD